MIFMGDNQTHRTDNGMGLSLPESGSTVSAKLPLRQMPQFPWVDEISWEGIHNNSIPSGGGSGFEIDSELQRKSLPVLQGKQRIKRQGTPESQ